MAREWQPGDVAWVYGEEPSGRSTIEFSEVGLRVAGGWQLAGGEVKDEWVLSVRPLVVIDPEDPEQVERLYRAYYSLLNNEQPVSRLIDQMQQALRAFANPTPPKPEEPTGLGAVVEDADGELWVRDKTTTTVAHWKRARGQMGGKRLRYSEINAVRVLSEGVQP